MGKDRTVLVPTKPDRPTAKDSKQGGAAGRARPGQPPRAVMQFVSHLEALAAGLLGALQEGADHVLKRGLCDLEVEMLGA